MTRSGDMIHKVSRPVSFTNYETALPWIATFVGDDG